MESDSPARRAHGFTHAINAGALGDLPDDLQVELNDQLHQIAEALMQSATDGHTLQATSLLNEAVVRISSGEQSRHFESRKHFFCFAAHAMRSILVDHARRKHSKKRGGDWRRVTLAVWAGAEATGPSRTDPSHPMASVTHLDLLDLSDALDALAEWRFDLAELVEMRYFGGLTSTELAALKKVSERTINRHLRVAVTWLIKRLGAEGEPGCTTRA